MEWDAELSDFPHAQSGETEGRRPSDVDGAGIGRQRGESVRKPP